jgi:hypothetical protein
MEQYMKQRNLVCEPQAVYNLKGDAARIEFINRFKEVQRLKTQRDQYTDIDEAQEQTINAILPEDELRSLRASYLETAQRLKAQQGNVEAIAEFGGNKKVRRGDIAYNMMRMWQGRVWCGGGRRAWLAPLTSCFRQKAIHAQISLGIYLSYQSTCNFSRPIRKV